MDVGLRQMSMRRTPGWSRQSHGRRSNGPNVTLVAQNTSRLIRMARDQALQASEILLKQFEVMVGARYPGHDMHSHAGSGRHTLGF
jgi:hypothetical protein